MAKAPVKKAAAKKAPAKMMKKAEKMEGMACAMKAKAKKK